MLIRSAGVIPYKIIDNEIYVYLEHPGGPYREGEDIWSVCKGEYNKKEKAVEAALREFKEESSYQLDKDKLVYLYSHKVSNRKLVTMFTINQDLDTTHMKSNTFDMEYPKGSGVINTYPEMDAARWIKIDEAEQKIFNNQKIFIRKLKEYLNESTNNI